LRAGWHNGLSADTDFFAEAGYGRIDVSTRLLGVEIGGAEGSGGALRAGSRTRLGERFEFGLAVTQAFYADQGITLDAGFAFRIGESFGITFDYSAGESVDAVSAGLRWEF